MNRAIRLIVLIGGVLGAAAGADSPGRDPQIAVDFGLAAPLPPTPGGSTQTVLYTGDPVVVLLGVGQERRLRFDGPVEIGLADPSAPIDIQIYDHNVLLRALAPLSLRLIITPLTGGAVGQAFPIDVRTVHTEQPLGALHIVTAGPHDETRSTGAATASDDGNAVTVVSSAALARRPPTYIAMTRHAIQQFYAPARLVTPLPLAEPAAVDPKPVRLSRYQQVSTTPMAAWRVGAVYLTAVEVVNRLARRTVLDPRHLVGRWRTATFVHHQLAPAGQAGDTTMLALISDQPFETALGGRPADD